MSNAGTLVFWTSAFITAVSAMLEPREDEAQKAKLVEQRAEQCRVLTRALDVVGYQSQRPDLMQDKDSVPPCRRPEVEGCAYTVEVEFELLRAERLDLAAQIYKALDLADCDTELRFALKHGLPAYRDLRAIVDKTIDKSVPYFPR